MTKTQEVVLRMQVDNLSLEVERQNEEIKKLTAVVQNHARFLSAGEGDGEVVYDLLAAENKENLREYIRSTIKSDAFISAGTFSLSGLD